jgi:hypothetical protein
MFGAGAKFKPSTAKKKKKNQKSENVFAESKFQ